MLLLLLSASCSQKYCYGSCDENHVAVTVAVDDDDGDDDHRPPLFPAVRQAVFDGFPDGLPDLTPLGVKLSLEVDIVIFIISIVTLSSKLSKFNVIMIILYQAMLGPAGEMNAIPGEAGVDYPVYNTGIIMMVMMMITISLYDYHHIQHLVFNTSQTSA